MSELWDWYRSELKSHPDITFSTTDRNVMARLQQQFTRGEVIHVNMQGWHGAAYVLRLNYNSPLNGYERCDALLRPTGRPTSRPDALTMRKDAFSMAMAPLAGKSPSHMILDDPYAPVVHTRQVSTDTLKKVTEEGLRMFKASLAAEKIINRTYFDQTVYTIKKETPVKIRNKYYVAADRVSNITEQTDINSSPTSNSHRWTKKDLKDAIAHAETMLEREPQRDHVVIVKMIRIVRRKKAPLVVEVL